ncbi:hypothetical protein [Pseudonocardia sp.]|uniref:hypothetical protein n=1 Tax=Pseudonocardia sp. TaxID=60912 RepID=UPI003D12746A
MADRTSNVDRALKMQEGSVLAREVLQLRAREQAARPVLDAAAAWLAHMDGFRDFRGNVGTGPERRLVDAVDAYRAATEDDYLPTCPECGHDSDHSGGACMWYSDELVNGESVQRTCGCTGSAEAGAGEHDTDGVHRDDVYPDVTRALLRIDAEAGAPAAEPAPPLQMRRMHLAWSIARGDHTADSVIRSESSTRPVPDDERLQYVRAELRCRGRQYGKASETIGHLRNEIAALRAGAGAPEPAQDDEPDWAALFAKHIHDDTFREAFHRAEREYDDTHCSCGGDRWVDDQNWEPAFRGDRRQPGGPGRLPCGFCNEGGWDVADCVALAAGAPQSPTEET